VPGFPESWYSWRHQLAALSAAGFHAVVPDMRGYRQTDYVVGDRDLVVHFRSMDQLLPNLTRFVPELRKTVMLPGCGHWTQQERPEAVNAEMIEFLRGLA
jgi:pimeloyl-ACP methyl ester carboxylesterase